MSLLMDKHVIYVYMWTNSYHGCNLHLHTLDHMLIYLCNTLHWKKSYWIQYSYWSEWMFTHFGSFFWNCHNVSASQLEVSVTWCFPFLDFEQSHQWTANRDTGCLRSTTSSCFLSSSREGKHLVTKTSSWEAETLWQFQKHDLKWVKSPFTSIHMYKISNMVIFSIWFLLHAVHRVWNVNMLTRRQSYMNKCNSTVSEWRHENSWILISHTSGRLSDKLFTEMACGYRNALPNTCLALLLCTLNSKNIMSFNC